MEIGAHCGICGGRLGLFKKHRAADGRFCHKCFVAAGFSDGADYSNDTLEKLKVTIDTARSLAPAPKIAKLRWSVSVSTRSKQSSVRLPLSKREAEMMAKQWIKQASDSARILNTTKNAKVFFERFDFFIDTLERLAFCERWVRFRGELPSVKLRSIEAERREQTRLFILRYAQDTREKIQQLSTERGKINKAETFYKTMTEYTNHIDDDLVSVFTEQYNSLRRQAGGDL